MHTAAPLSRRQNKSLPLGRTTLCLRCFSFAHKSRFFCNLFLAAFWPIYVLQTTSLNCRTKFQACVLFRYESVSPSTKKEEKRRRRRYCMQCRQNLVRVFHMLPIPVRKMPHSIIKAWKRISESERTWSKDGPTNTLPYNLIPDQPRRLYWG